MINSHKITWSRIQAVLFDFDGVVVHSEPLYEKAEMELIQAMGLKIPDDFFHHNKGIGEDAFYQVLIDQYGAQKSVAELKQWGRKLLKEKFRDHLDYVPGFQDFFHWAAERFQTAVVTSTRRDFMDWIFAHTRIENVFTELGTIDDVERGKPEPDPYLNMCERLGIEPAEALVIEDSLLGLHSARRAGCQTVGITTTIPADRLAEIADGVIGHFNQLQAFLERREYFREMV
ncbi:MAG: HAD family phosphatase [Candidatus Marinimicrobia bacterium]|nr:HAD family phosphatase [Candidatus Neomarinimicrobiota bacterium]